MSDGNPTKRMSDASFGDSEGDGTMNMSTSTKIEEMSGDRNDNHCCAQSKIEVLVHLVGTGSSSGLDENLQLPPFFNTGKSEANVSQMVERALEWLGMEKEDCDKILVKCKSEKFGKMVNLMPEQLLEDSKEYEMQISRDGKEEKEKEEMEELRKIVEQLKKDQDEAKSENAALKQESQTKIADCQKRSEELLAKLEDSKKNMSEMEKKSEVRDREWQAKMEEKEKIEWQAKMKAQEEKYMQEIWKKPTKMRPELNPYLLAAVKGGKLAEVGKLIDEGADVNAELGYRKSVLHLAVKKGNAKMVKLLAERGANLEVKDNLGWRPLHWAIISEEEVIVSLLLAKGAYIKSTDNDGWTALHSAANVNFSLTIVRTLLAHSLEKFGKGGKMAFLNAKDNYGWTALHRAYLFKKMDLVDLLLKNGADGTIKNNDGKTPNQM